MAREIVCISPVDGSEYLRRRTATSEEIAAALSRARAAQREWRRVPVADRAAIVVRLIDALEAMGPSLGEDLTRQMGRPIRYGLGELRGSRERAEHMAKIAPEAIIAQPPPSHTTVAPPATSPPSRAAAAPMASQEFAGWRCSAGTRSGMMPVSAG